jgi:pyrroline-5-carboxylate reductase
MEGDGRSRAAYTGRNADFWQRGEITSSASCILRHPSRMALHAPVRPAAEAVAFIGGGQMALALAEGFTVAGLVAPEAITVYDPAASARERLASRVVGIRLAETATEAAAAAELVWLAVKPQQAAEACREIAGLMADRTLVSIAAGLSTSTLVRLAGAPQVVRVMPNTPCLIGHGVSVLCHTAAVTPAAARRVRALLAAVGHVHEVDESLLDAVTGLSGSGPGFLALITEALADGGVKAGLPRPLALSLAVQTMAGTGLLLERTGDHPAVVKDKVSSPGGTTIAGLGVLEERGVRGAIIDAVTAAAARARELGG